MSQSVAQQTEDKPAAVPPVRRRLSLQSLRELTLLPAIAGVIIAGSFLNSSFLTTGNFINIAQFSAALGAVVVAESLVLLVGDLDLSLQSVYGLAPLVAAWLIVPKSAVGLGSDLPPALGIVVLLAIGLGIGLFNGVMIVKGRFNSFIFTLAMLILLAGIQQGIVSGNTIYAMPAAFVYLGSAAWLSVPVSAWASGFIFVGCGLFLRYHRTGRAIYTIGGNVEAAQAAGIRVDPGQDRRVRDSRSARRRGGPHDGRACRCRDSQPGQQPDLHRVCCRGDRRHLARRRTRPDPRRVHRRRAAGPRAELAGAVPGQHLLDQRRGRSDHPGRADTCQVRRRGEAMTSRSRTAAGQSVPA